MRLFLLFILLNCLASLSCKQKEFRKEFIKTDTTFTAGKILKIDSILSSKEISDSLQLQYQLEKASLCHSIGQWANWGAAILKCSELKYNMSIDKIWVHTMLDSVIALKKLQSRDSGINKAIANAIYWQYISYGYFDQLFNQQIRYGEQFLTDPSTKYLLEKDYTPKLNYLKITYSEAYTRIGDYSKAKSIQEKYLTEANLNGNNETKTANALTLANTMNKMLLWKEALVIEKQFLNLSDVTKASKANLFGVYAETLTNTGDTANAIKYYNKAIQLVEGSSERNDIYSHAQILANYAWLLFNNKKINEALFVYKKSVDAYNKFRIDSRENAKNYISISDCFLALHQLDSAILYNNKAILNLLDVAPGVTLNYDSIKSNLYEENAIMDAFDSRAAILQMRYQQDKNTAGLEEIINASKIGFSVQWLLLSSYDFSGSLDNENVRGRQRSQMAIDACYQLLQQTKDPKWTLIALEMAEKSKAIVLQQTLKRQLAVANINSDTLLKTKQILEEQLTMLSDTAGLSKNAADSVAAASSRLTERLANIQSQLNIKYPNLKTALSKEDIFDITVIKEKLIDSKTALLEYFVDTSNNYVFSVTKNGNATMEMLPQTGIVNANKWQQYFTNKNEISNNFNAFVTEASIVYQQLFPAGIQQILENNAIENMVLVPDGQLGCIPFDALITTSQNNAAEKATIPYLINRFTITNGYSAQSLLLRKERSKATGTAVFAPLFLEQQRGLAPLKYSEAEANICTNAVAKSTSYLQQKATVQSFTNVLPGLSLIHLATHASAGDSTLPQIEFYDTCLNLNRIYTLSINANLVILSACQTGIGKLQTGEGPLSLARGFYYAGARQVITSLWNVDDKSNATIFKDFYGQNWQHETSTALRQAKIDYIKNADEIKASPYYWAGMVIFGVDNNDNKSSYIWMVISGAILIISAIIIYGYKKRKKPF